MSKNPKPQLDFLEEEPSLPYSRYIKKNITVGDTSPTQNYEYPTGISLTVPDQGTDLRLMLNRAKSGQMVPHRDGVYHDQDLPDLYKMDDVELMQYRMDLADQMQQMSQDLHDATKALEQKQAEMALEQAIEARLKDEKKPDQDDPKA